MKNVISLAYSIHYFVHHLFGAWCGTCKANPAYIHFFTGGFLPGKRNKIDNSQKIESTLDPGPRSVSPKIIYTSLVRGMVEFTQYSV